MHAVVGPILLKEGRYAFDLWTPEEGLSCGYAYRRIEDAHYARNAEIRSRRRGGSGGAVALSTLDEFTLAVTAREASFRVLLTNLEVRAPSPTRPPERQRWIPIAAVQYQ